MNSGEKEKLGVVGEYLLEHYIGKDKKFKTKNELAAALSKSRQTLYLVMSGTQPISYALANQLSAKVGKSSNFWISLANQKDSKLFDIEYENITKEELLDFWIRVGARYFVDRDIIAAQRLGIIKMEPFSEACVQATSYDCRLGKKLYSTSSDRIKEINLDQIQTFEIKAGSRVVCNTMEYIYLPKYLVGNLGNIGELCMLGLNVSHGIQVDPTFSGNLWLSIYNYGPQAFQLNYGSPIISMEISFLPVAPNKIYKGERKNKEELSENERRATINTAKHKKDNKNVIDFLKEKLDEYEKE
jgi:deoxycytidine triphosphate deaminase